MCKKTRFRDLVREQATLVAIHRRESGGAKERRVGSGTNCMAGPMGRLFSN